MVRRVQAFFLIVVLALIFLKLTTSYFFNTDYTRDLYRVLNITQGHPTLIGPPLSVGIFSTPYYYYFILPSLLLSGYSPYAFLIFNAIIFLAGIIIISILLSKRGKVLPILGMILSPFFLMAARGASNAYLYIPLLMIYLYYILFTEIYKETQYLLLGVLAGLILNFHPVSLIAVLPISIVLFHRTKIKKHFWVYLLPILASLIPMILFELKHEFVVTRGLLSGNYKNFIANTVSRDFISSLMFIIRKFQELLGINPLIYFSGLFLIVKKVDDKKYWWLYLCALFSFLVTILVLRFQYEPHYLFPACVLIAFTAVMALSRVKSSLLTILWIGILLFSFPTNLYKPSTRAIEKYSVAVQNVLKNNILSKSEIFNVLGIIDSSNKVVNGNEYRFFLAKAGYQPLSESEYSAADTLLVFSEDKNYPISQLHTWETEQFGQQYLRKAQVYDSGDILIYRISKQ